MGNCCGGSTSGGPSTQRAPPVRRAHLAALREVWRACTLLCTQRELCGGALVASAGSQLRAVNAKGRHLTNANREQVSAQLDARVAGDQDEAGTPGGAHAADLPTTIEALRGRRRRDEDLQAALERRGQEPLSLPAPASGAMQGGHGVVRRCAITSRRQSRPHPN
jgi:hypothetical protein